MLSDNHFKHLQRYKAIQEENIMLRKQLDEVSKEKVDQENPFDDFGSYW